MTTYTIFRQFTGQPETECIVRVDAVNGWDALHNRCVAGQITRAGLYIVTWFENAELKLAVFTVSRRPAEFFIES